MEKSHILTFSAICLPVCIVHFLTPCYLRLQKYEKMVVVNYRGAKVVTAGGLLLFAAILPLQLFCRLFLPGGYLSGWPVLLYWGGITFLGLIDDLQGEKKCKGFRGHFLQCWQGKGVSTGLYKAAGGLISGVFISAWLGGEGGWLAWLCKGIFLALFSNLFNLLDTRPARAAKTFFLFSFILMLVYWNYYLPLLSLWSALYIYLFWELAEKIMLGDTGAYLLGGVLGLHLVFLLPLKIILFFSGGLLILHYLGEKFSWSDLLENKIILLHWQFPGRRN